MFDFFRNKTYLSEEIVLVPDAVDNISAKVRPLGGELGLNDEMQIKLCLALETVLINWMEFFLSRLSI